MRYRLALRFLGISAIVGIGFCLFTPLPNLAAEYLAVPSTDGPAGAIVVLGGGQLHDGSLNDPSMRRFMHGISLYRRGLAKFIVLLGPHTSKAELSEAEVRAAATIEFGVPKDAVIAISTAYTTREEALLSSDALRHRGVEKIILVTESMHMRRARLAFKKVGLHVLTSASDNVAESAVSPGERFELVLRLGQETLALLYYRIAGYM